ncbi:Alpha-ribazole phosphatase [Acholeplasma oculi]|uniref:Phosphoglycerate mutase n=1 Tax=Acholeplasma oculi TaxID=35623 RepID=A0A061ABP2_9MOLU|nr:histidine phosphatase family protein [Acholeplasma oculi]CDR30829.1 Phosphoglycerate mutase [Acholeplasma oculi]SKC35168.1 probable phosphoglycerate mutase [Acholeplasma oculi]SUT89855.1 Alpha-ribazole phosphatase [Acholeplasma oculi]
MIIAMIRHGETDYNKKQLVQGRMDNPLNSEGIHQAETLGTYLRDNNETFDVLISSPLKRALKTAEIVGSYIGLQVNYTDKNLLERDFGPFEGKSIDEVLPIITLDDFRKDGFEDNPSLQSRILSAVQRISNLHSHQKVLIVAHAHVIKSLIILSNKDKFTYTNHFVGNSSIVYFKITDDTVEVIKQYDL